MLKLDFGLIGSVVCSYILANRNLSQVFKISLNPRYIDTWLANYNLLNLDWYIQYVSALYWAVETMTTIGYGDISPQTPTERTIGVLFLLFSSFVFAYTMNSIGAALQQINEKKEDFR